jgi:hypothetical protein
MPCKDCDASQAKRQAKQNSTGTSKLGTLERDVHHHNEADGVAWLSKWSWKQASALQEHKPKTHKLVMVRQARRK